MKRTRKKRAKKYVNRKTGYYWIKVSNGQNDKWIIGKWWNNIQFWDTMGTIREIGIHDKIVEVDEEMIKRQI